MHASAPNCPCHIGLLPSCDPLRRGYGWDKHVHTLHAVRQLGMKLVVHPDAWLVHLPHEHSAAQSLSKETGQVRSIGPYW